VLEKSPASLLAGLFCASKISLHPVTVLYSVIIPIISLGFLCSGWGRYPSGYKYFYKMVPVLQQKKLRCCAFAALLLLSPCALAGGVVVTGAKSPLSSLSKEQVRDLYLGNISSLPDGRNATLIDQPQSSPLRDEFYLKVTNKSAAQAKAQWAKLYFTGRGMPPREGMDSADIKRILNSTPDAIGYIEESDLDSSVKVIFVVQ
jgi:hypothetical protein